MSPPVQSSSGHPKEVSEFPISDRPTKSRLRSLFSRRKSDKDTKDQTNTNQSPAEMSITARPASRHQTFPVPRPATRSRSTTWSNRGFKGAQKSVKSDRPRALTAWDPPPLFQATTQAVLQAVLDIPSSFTEAVFRNAQTRPSSTSSETSWGKQRQDQVGAGAPKVDGKDERHRRNWSSSSTCSLTQKLFVLVDRGYILQYSADGNPDRLPEKILELGPGSVAIASDALPGKHWVLRVSQDGKADQLQTQTPKPSWSRLPFRSTEVKRLVKDFLLVFESARDFDAWLTAVRKEIEALGGLEYRPDSRGLEGEMKRLPTLRLPVYKSFGAFTKSSSDLPLTALEQLHSGAAPQPSPTLPQLLSPLTTLSLSRKSVASSSVNTATDLDRLRESSFSDSNTTARTSVDGSATGSPARDSFPANSVQKQPLMKISSALASSKSLSKPKGSSLAPKARTESRRSFLADPGLLWSFEFQRTPMLPTEQFHSLLNTPPIGVETTDFLGTRFASGTLSANEPTYNMPPSSERNALETDVPDRPVSTIAPLPTPGSLKKTGSRYRRENGLAQVQLATSTTIPSPTVSCPTPTSSHSKSTSQDSTGTTGPRRTSSYSLFPRRGSSLEGSQRQSYDRSTPTPPATDPTAVEDSLPLNNGVYSPNEVVLADKSQEVAPPHSVPQMGRRKNLSVNTIHQHNSIDAKHQPQRSPAVSEAHIATCFGLEAPMEKSLPPIPVEADETSITTTTIELPALVSEPTFEVHVPKLSLPPKGHRVSPRKSMPSLLYSAVPPLGPPPSGPLPAVPTAALAPTSSPRALKPNHARGKSSVSSMASQSSAKARMQGKHVRTTSSVSSVASVASSAIPSAPISPVRLRHIRKPSSVSSIGSVSEWIAPSTSSTTPASENVPKLSLGLSPTPTITPITPKFSTGGMAANPTTKSQAGTVNPRPRFVFPDDIDIASPGTAL